MVRRSNLSRIDMLREAGKDGCVCEGKWLQCACEILVKNGLHKNAFAESIYVLLLHGRGKYRNLMITGPANCGKTFIFNPLREIYKTFTNPATGTFAWVGAELAEVIFLNDFRWNPKLLPWHDLLLLLEGQTVHLPAPKSHYACDIVFEKSTPILCTGKQPLVYISGGSVDERETEMMSVRWKCFSFSYQIPACQQVNVASCAYCFSHLVLDNVNPINL